MPPYLVWIMAFASGATVANLYYNQPLLAIMAQNFQAPPHAIGFIPMLTQIGYATGILLFVPLGDLTEQRRLIVTMLGATTVTLALAAIAQNLIWLVAAHLGIGMTAIAAQVIVPFAAQLTPAPARGKVVGTIMGGLLIGILVARTVSGFVGAIWGWRAMYWLASGLMLVLAVTLSTALPRHLPALQASYLNLMRSLVRLIRTQPVLQEASMIGAMCFGAFSAFWTTLVFFLAQPPYHYGSEVTGLFGLVGIVGASAAPLVGRLADRSSPKLTVGLGITITTIAFVVFLFLGHQIWGLIIGVILLDLGVQSTQVSNQARIYSLPLEMHSRFNALYIMFYFVGGALGSFLGSYGWSHWQWNGVCGLSLLMLTVAFVAFFRSRQK
ncbi:MAG: MFS transporter [Chroococcidiopsidaceae cyanobacterium CP_BM_RX_35]|nr:MFS transporter [Chroococcidiopsidaceae cyanobacterium CP_BM_RX_35]